MRTAETENLGIHAGDDGLGEGGVDALFDAGSAVAGAEGEVLLHDHYFGTDALELNDAAFTAAGPVEADAAGAAAFGDGGEVKDVLIEAGDFEEESALVGVPEHGDVTFAALEAGLSE